MNCDASVTPIGGERSRLEQTAWQIRATLDALGAEFAGLAELDSMLGVDRSMLTASVLGSADLGLAGSPERPVVYCVAPAAVPAGFQVLHTGDRMVLRLPPAAGSSWPLIISGEHLIATYPDRVDADDLGAYGTGELGRSVAQMASVVGNWLAEPPEPVTPYYATLRLFDLITAAWRRSSGLMALRGRLHVCRADLVPPFRRGRIELVVWADKQQGYTLVEFDALPGSGESSAGRRQR